MTAALASVEHSRLVSLERELAAIVGKAHVSADEAQRRFHSSDLFFWDDAEVASLMVAPGTAAEAAAVVRAIAAAGAALYARGGGMSTGCSYVPTVADAVMLDMRRLDRVRAIDTVDRYAIVEAGCTWQTLYDELRPHGLRPDFPLVLSGNVSTIGGALSHNVSGGMHGVLGLEVVRANGELLRTGSWARAEHGEPFYREYGPDLTGLFLGDTGAFGIKTAASLHLGAKPEEAAYASFSYSSYEDLAQTMSELGPYDFANVRVGFDPYDTRHLAQVGLTEAAATLRGVLRSGSLAGGLRSAWYLASHGARGLEAGEWSLHLRVEQLTREAAEHGIGRVRPICLRRGRDMPSTIAHALSAYRFSVRRFLGREGERWIATNSLWPIGRAAEVARAVDAFFELRREALAEHGIRIGCLSVGSPMHFQSEPFFYWFDEVSELQLAHLDPEEAARFAQLPARPATRALVKRMRGELRDLFERMGALHVHTSKFFRYRELLMPGTQTLLDDLKRTLDPGGVLNPRNLGL